jgi:hypothetical protein
MLLTFELAKRAHKKNFGPITHVTKLLSAVYTDEKGVPPKVPYDKAQIAD